MRLRSFKGPQRSQPLIYVVAFSSMLLPMPSPCLSQEAPRDKPKATVVIEGTSTPIGSPTPVKDRIAKLERNKPRADAPLIDRIEWNYRRAG
jgi:hypothetical protein